MDQGPLVSDEIDAGAELVREFDKSIHGPVEVAFWLKSAESDYRYLYIASKHVHERNLWSAYAEIVKLIYRKRSPFLDPFRVKLLNANDTLARAAIEVNENFPAPIGTRLGGIMFGGRYVDDVYIYPSPLPAEVS